MKVLHIISGLNDGGAEAVLYRLATSKDSTFQHSVLSLLDGGKYGPLLEKQGVDVYCLNMLHNKLSFFSVFKIFSLIRLIKPDVVQTWMFHGDFFGGIFARLAGVKNVVWGIHHTHLIKGESKKTTIIISKINASLSKILPRKIIYCAKKSREIHELYGYPKNKGCVVSNGYDIENFIPNFSLGVKVREELNVGKVFLIGHVGRFDPLKDYKNLIEALGFLKKDNFEFRVVLVGSNLDENNYELKGFIDSNLDSKIVSLLGRRNDIVAIMNSLDLFILSSVSEAFPNVLNEAMACGIPCVTTDVGDAAHIVGNTGWVVPPKNPRMLSDAIAKAFVEQDEQHEKWIERKELCRIRIVENFGLKKMVSFYEKVWIEGINE